MFFLRPPAGGDAVALAEAVASSPAWAETPGAALVVRAAPRPVLGVMGRFDGAAEARLAALGPQIGVGLARTRRVDYARAEEDCELLAEGLVRRFGRGELRGFRFTAVPRGGLIVLGMLSYVLDLERAQLEPPHPPDAPLVVVDDCALSGYRFADFLSRRENDSIVFAHLYSHPDLRAAVEAREPRVVACLGARDLHDYAPEDFGAGYAAWKRSWLSRLDDPGYWVGQPERLSFPWSETDVSIWNPVTERVERGWRTAPPASCLKHRPGREAIPVQVQPEGAGPLRPSARTLFGELRGSVVVGNVEAGTSFELAGVAADMWRAIVAHGDPDAAADSLAGDYEVDETTLRSDLRGFADDLLARDLLETEDALVPRG